LKKERRWYILNPKLSISKRDLEQVATRARKQLESIGAT